MENMGKGGGEFEFQWESFRLDVKKSFPIGRLPSRYEGLLVTARRPF